MNFSRSLEYGMSQLHGMEATDTVYAFGAVVVVYMFIVMKRDKIRS